MSGRETRTRQSPVKVQNYTYLQNNPNNKHYLSQKICRAAVYFFKNSVKKGKTELGETERGIGQKVTPTVSMEILHLGAFLSIACAADLSVEPVVQMSSTSKILLPSMFCGLKSLNRPAVL